MGRILLRRRLVCCYTRSSRPLTASLIGGFVFAVLVWTERGSVTPVVEPEVTYNYLDEIEQEFSLFYDGDIRLPVKYRDNQISRDIDKTEYHLHLLEAKLKGLSRTGNLRKIKEGKPCGTKEDVFSTCIDANCTSRPTRMSRPQNILDVRKPINAVGGITKLREVIKTFEVKPTKKKYLFLTGASSDHFKESEASVKSLYDNVFPHLTNYSLVYYDLGLTWKQRRVVQNITGLEYKAFPFKEFQTRFQMLRCFTWKPLIILAHMDTSEFVVWMDSSVYFAKDSRGYFEQVSKTGLLINKNELLFAQQVFLKTFSYFGEEACHFSGYGELEGGFLVFHDEPFVRHLVLEPWSACALDEACMCPAPTRSMHACDMKTRNYGKCHRFDQSVLGLIVIKLFREFVESIIITNKTHSIKRGQMSNFMTNIYLGRQPQPRIWKNPGLLMTTYPYSNATLY